MATRGAARNGRSNAAPASPGGATARYAAGGPGQPITPVAASRPGGQQGDRQASIEQQRAAPLRQGGVVTPAPAPMDMGAAEAPPINADQVWGPTERPWEPVTAGAGLGPGAAPPNPDEATAALLLELYRQHENDVIRDVLEELQGGMGR